MSYPTITLDQIASSQGEVTFNELAAAMSRASLFSVNQRLTVGLRLALWGGMMPTLVGPTAVANQSVTLTPSTTNYIYADTAGVIAKTTTAPTGWPGPLANGGVALYQLAVGANSITSGTCYLVGIGEPGVAGQTGATGPAGDELWRQRKRVLQIVGNAQGLTVGAIIGFDWTATTLTNRNVDPSTFQGAVPYSFMGAGPASGSSANIYGTQNLWYRGNAAGRGGFEVSMRWGIDTTWSAAANMRSFFGLYDVGGGAFGNVEPDTRVNLIGVGANAGEANLSLIHNDGSGTATKTLLGSDGSPTQTFPAKSANAIYELTLTAAAFGSEIAYHLLRADTGDEATGAVSSDLPSDTTFLNFMMWANNGTTASTTGFNMIQVIGNSRY